MVLVSQKLEVDGVHVVDIVFDGLNKVLKADGEELENFVEELEVSAVDNFNNFGQNFVHKCIIDFLPEVFNQGHDEINHGAMDHVQIWVVEIAKKLVNHLLFVQN